MKISLLQFTLIISTSILLYIIIDAGKRKKLRIFHTLIFISSLLSILIVTFYPQILSTIAHVVGVGKGSDFLVYLAIIFLVFVFFSLLQNFLQQQQDFTRLCSQLAIRDYKSTAPIFPSGTTKDKFLFLIRAYNEGSVLKSVIEEIITHGFSKIVIVNDGSKDNTEYVVEQLIEQYNSKATVIGLHHIINRGPGAANKTLFAFAQEYCTSLGCERCVTYDADGQMDINDMTTFMKHADHNKYDIIIGSRFVPGGSAKNIPFVRKCILQGARVITYIFNGLWITDVPTGYRMYHHTILSKITLVSDRFSYQNDIIDSIRQHHLRFIEIPVHIKYTQYSLQKGQSNMSALKILIRLIYSSLFQR